MRSFSAGYGAEFGSVLKNAAGYQDHSPYTKGNFDRQSRRVVDCRLAGGPAAGLKCYGGS
jgi:hypothetical protein